MNLEDFFDSTSEGVEFTRHQASRFAKTIADDFNPIHDEDAKRFCVPGDLLFSVALSKLGVSQKMKVTFSDMVTDGIPLKFNHVNENEIEVIDSNGKVYLALGCEREVNRDEHAIKELIQQYVAFSGKTFPHVLVPLWKDKGVMVNPSRPLVIYESMSLDLDDINFSHPILEFTDATFDVNGKRGSVSLKFVFKEGDKTLGVGEKRMILSGLKPFDQTAVDNLVSGYLQRKENQPG